MEFVKVDYGQIADSFDLDIPSVRAIYEQFMEYGFIIFTTKFNGGALLNIKANAFDFKNHGGFEAKDEILKANIEKLSLEIDKLYKDMQPDLQTRAKDLLQIATNIGNMIKLLN